MGTGATNDLVVEIFGELGALRFNSADPSWLEVYDVRDAGQPIGGMRGFRKIETVQNYPGAKMPDWTMTPTFLRTHAECQYQFLKAVAEDRPASPTMKDGLHIQAVMEAAMKSSQEERWVRVDEVFGERVKVMVNGSRLVTTQAAGGARSVMQAGTKGVPSRAKCNESSTRWPFLRAVER